MHYLPFLFFALKLISVANAACTKRHTATNNTEPTSIEHCTNSNINGVLAHGRLHFTTVDTGSYISTRFPCKNLKGDGYAALILSLKGSVDASLTIGLQTSPSCLSALHSSYYTSLNLTTEETTKYVIPLNFFKGANLNSVHSFVLKDFTPGHWEIGENSFARESDLETGGISSNLLTFQSTSAVAQSILSRDVAVDCSPHLIEDFVSQSRLTFLFYNSDLLPSSDDGTMKPVSGRVDTQTSVLVSKNHVTMTPTNKDSYWYTQLGCLKATNKWGGIGLTIKAEPGTTLRVELESDASCSNTNSKKVSLMATDLGWNFDGSEKYYQIPFSKFPGLDTNHLVNLFFSGLDRSITFGPIALYCGETGTAYKIPLIPEPAESSSTIPPSVGTSYMLIDNFSSQESNSLGFYHGGDDQASFKIIDSRLKINTKGNADQSWYTQVANGCTDLTPIQNGYLHLSFSGSNSFSISLQQHNPTCNDQIQPSPFTWDSVEASRYSNSMKTEIYVPLTHFAIDRSKSIGFALKGFYTSNPTTISKIEIVKNVPQDFLVPSKLPIAPLIFSCTRPNSFAFAIDDGEPKFAQRIVSIVDKADIKVTFFTVGAALRDSSTNLTGVYKGMLNAGHQVAYHSYTHPPMEGLPSLSDIDWELNQDIEAVKETLGITSTYFRPPFGTEGARIRQRLQSLVPGSKFVMWSVDVQDYLWANSPTPEKQITNFQSDVAKGGNLVVMHYLYDSTVSYLPKFIEIAKATGKQLMRVDQCLEDPNAPPL
ncbi:putative chitin deacetylase [Golovinomyces cichoracearum]|uniref:Putative chitin deacetylase n=1 Tax=Golovinomyces cichoracearum TaxID=62708 RepID=A0A420IR75_9PEZI|nr:putative chitin deacetylase [Golovinomyces cichoracearum]